MIWLLLLVALVTGMLLPVQVGVNAELRIISGNPILAAAIQFLVGTFALIVVLIAMRVPWPDIGKLSSAPWWVWTGGLLGANYIVVLIVLAPRLGAATMIGAVMTGQMLTSLIVDHFGLIGYPVHPASGWRFVGAGLLLLGLGLIQRF